MMELTLQIRMPVTLFQITFFYPLSAHCTPQTREKTGELYTDPHLTLLGVMGALNANFLLGQSEPLVQ